MDTATKGIKGITINIGGNTSPLQKALQEVNTKTKDLSSELKQVDRLLKLDPKNTELLAQKQKLLADSVQASKDKLSQLKDAQKQVEQQFKDGKIGEEQFRAFQREVQSAEQNLKSLEAQLKETKKPLKDLTDGLDGFGNKATDMGKKLMPVTGVIAGVATGAATLAINTGKAADDINTLAKQTGLTTEAIQKFQYASDIIDVPLETFTGSLAKLTKNMQSAKNGSKNVVSAFDELGISFLDSNGQLRNNQDVFYDVIDALGKMENQTQRDALAMQIFGKSAQDLNPLMLGGADSLKQMGEEAEKAGLILSQDALDAANAFNDELDILKATAKGTYSQLGVEIGTMLMPYLKKLLETIKVFMTWLRGLDAGTLKVIGTIALLVVGIAPLLIIVGQVALGISSLITLGTTLTPIIGMATTAFKAFNLTLLANPIGILIASIVVLIAIFAHLWKTNEDFRNYFITTWTSIKDFFTVTLDSLSNIAKAKFGFIFDSIMSVFKAFKALFQGDFKGFLTGIWDMAVTWASGWRNLGQNIVSGVWQGIQDMASWFYEQIKSFFSSAISSAISAAKSAFTGGGGSSSSGSSSVSYNKNTDYQALINEAKANGAPASEITKLEKQREAKIKGEGITKYASGGVVDFTGLAQLDGTKFKSETIFNSGDSKKLYDLIHNMPSLTSYFANLMKSSIGAMRLNLNGGSSQNKVTIQMGDIIVQGNADEITLNKIRQIAQSQVDALDGEIATAFRNLASVMR
ncbi:hypothetical protein [Sinanaerobacter chloroacetimidivorans]|uniref:Phage tail tape measure protein n=1 Tax=Sinanaerobacter chloroacetimidivorans TaxID=2818044 RepID=A0A8J8B2T0_9FIRM|nr:hypothetical protein [Sinanaerobacter chloroacetimidivorans]MBR0599051.1 hypothetical protein [Sinanaerobacter chloroacetimidivorans]